ncbi:unnamed protein product [Caenorhabditis nigoni]
MMDSAGTEEINKSYIRKFDEITEKLQVIEESVAKILKTNEDEKNNQKELNSEEKYAVLKRNDDRRLDLYIYCNPIAPIGNEFEVKVKAKYSMMGNGNIITKTLKHCFATSEGFSVTNFLEWEKIRHYLDDNKLTVEVEVEILKMTGFGKKMSRLFNESQKEFSDLILVMQNTKFYVLKMYLALQSSLFKYLLCEEYDVPENAEIELTEIEADNFHTFLELIHGNSSIDDGTVTGILYLADMLEAPTAIRRCEEFLLKDSQKSIVQKLQLALRYNLNDLKNNCLCDVTEITTIELIMSANLPEMDLSTSQALLQKSINFSNA